MKLQYNSNNNGMKLLYAIIVLLAFSFANIYANEKEWQLVTNHPNKERFELLLKQAQAEITDSNRMFYVQKMAALCENNFAEGNAILDYTYCFNYMNKQDYLKALKNGLKAYQLQAEIAPNTYHLLKTSYLVGLSYINLYNYNKSIPYLKLAKNISRKVGDHQFEYESAKWIAVAYFNLQKFDSSAYYKSQQLETLNVLGWLKNKDSIHHFSGIYNDLGYIAEEKGDYKKAIDYFTKSYQEYKKGKEVGNFTNELNNIARILVKQEKHYKAIRCIKEALKYEPYYNQENMLNKLESRLYLGKAYFVTGELDKGIEYLKEGIKLGENLNIGHEFLSQSYYWLAKCYEKSENFQMALLAKKNENRINDFLAQQVNEEYKLISTIEGIESEVLNDVDYIKFKQQNASNHTNWWGISLIGLVVLGIVFIIYSIQRNNAYIALSGKYKMINLPGRILNTPTTNFDATHTALNSDINSQEQQQSVDIYEIIHEVTTKLQQKIDNKKLNVLILFAPNKHLLSIKRDKAKVLIEAMIIDAIEKSPNERNIIITADYNSLSHIFSIEVRDERSEIPYEQLLDGAEPFDKALKLPDGIGHLQLKNNLQQLGGKIWRKLTLGYGVSSFLEIST